MHYDNTTNLPHNRRCYAPPIIATSLPLYHKKYLKYYRRRCRQRFYSLSHHNDMNMEVDPDYNVANREDDFGDDDDDDYSGSDGYGDNDDIYSISGVSFLCYVIFCSVLFSLLLFV